MKIKISFIVFSLSLLLCCGLFAQNEEKKYLTLREFNAMTASENLDEIYDTGNADTLTVNGKKYTMFWTPIPYNLANDLLKDKENKARFVTCLPSKKYILHWEIKNDSIYIVDYHITPCGGPLPGSPGNTKEDIRIDIEKVFGKKFSNGKLRADWIVVEDALKTIIRIYVRDSQLNVFCLTFENGKFIKIEEKNNVKVRQFL
jgi:hypothetical protein